MRPILFQIGDFRFYSFGLMAALALIVPGLTIVRPLVRRRGVPEEFAYELIIAAGIGGFVFARIYYLIENYAAIKAEFWHVAFSGAGFVWYGGLIGGFLGVVGWSLDPPLSRWTSSPTPWRQRSRWATPSAASAASSPATATTAR